MGHLTKTGRTSMEHFPVIPLYKTTNKAPICGTTVGIHPKKTGDVKALETLPR